MQVGEVNIDAGELLGQLPDGDAEEDHVEANDDTHRPEEAPDEALLCRQPAAMGGTHTHTHTYTHTAPPHTQTHSMTS